MAVEVRDLVDWLVSRGFKSDKSPDKELPPGLPLDYSLGNIGVQFGRGPSGSINYFLVHSTHGLDLAPRGYCSVVDLIARLCGVRSNEFGFFMGMPSEEMQKTGIEGLKGPVESVLRASGVLEKIITAQEKNLLDLAQSYLTTKKPNI